MPVDTAYARLVDANPVPDAGMLKPRVGPEAFLLDVTDGRRVMQTEMKPVEAEGGRSRSATWLRGVAAAAAVVVAIAIVFVARSGDVASTLSPGTATSMPSLICLDPTSFLRTGSQNQPT